MFSVEKRPVPADTLLEKLTGNDAYTDCYSTVVAGQVTLPQYISAFYTTPLFKLERLILKWSVSKPSTDADVRRLADGKVEQFAAWTVESRSDDQLLMCDFLGRTRSWLMVKVNETQTQLFFGSAVVPKAGTSSLEFGYRALLSFHQIYSVLLLFSAASKISRHIRRMS